MSTPFIPGLELARLFYAEAVRPVLEQRFPGLPYTAALIGAGSEVLGFDTPRSVDHDWGPRLQVFLADDAADAGVAAQAAALLADQLPAEFRGSPTVFALSADQSGEPSHQIVVTGLRHWLTGALGFDPLAPIGLADWLAAPCQLLAEVTGGAVFHDGLAAAGPGLADARARLRWYPHDIWLHVMACQWQRLSQEEPFPGRCAETGDELGSMVVTARLARDLMRLAPARGAALPALQQMAGHRVRANAGGSRHAAAADRRTISAELARSRAIPVRGLRVGRPAAQLARGDSPAGPGGAADLLRAALPGPRREPVRPSAARADPR